ncbi:hypothetical protein PHYBLDRAFT_141562 [Phycomyces blakesleeanus NRRL 1555(-)]|uniref:Autophagy-related protein 27 n=1 Tax=Phycomyces blakesleeanus (strain ATCC 8743b / DSM 1359 / FGSC 10004 / NBRC 33097 / NRRL 1555) TaxID=763407 RepID=A0A167PD45_PHYB8|nr:hypothetical protein PHYBLDRAFT_141562 [Phycomyces blakesleeanus NRRL 1555(-)]OAD77696.1 hypothetical protein PHYBLDRAFT_141562 [Phycomyces blakesleeanus NRRL 1555(-)]|eukprot:XP_018295736.1 hypothetical protein PHYBLDRAFT_141562 [Phycomyces blakesleeanus NRRL 1555(-)]
MKVTFGLSLALFASSVLAIQDYCNPHFKPIAEAGYELDLSRLNKEFVVTQKASTVPATRTTEIKINICDALPAPKENDVDDCPKGSYICRRIIYNKDGKDIVTEVQTISGDFDKEKKLVGNFKAPEDEEDLSNDGIVYTLELGGGKVGERAQSAQITLECDKSISREDEPKPPTVLSYTSNKLTLRWKTALACAVKPDEKKPDNGNDKKGDETPQPKEGMSGVGIFFTTVLVLLAIYFVGGAFYNFKMYNAQGLDLIPHRDFWFDLPYLIKDIFSHLVDTIMSHRRGSGGYVAV